MNGMKRLSVVLILLTLTACASGTHRTVYYEYREPARHISVGTTVHHPSPIEVTIYAGQGYRGRGFMPIHLIIADGEYIQIPVRHNRGHTSRIYAHYLRGVLHFDSDRNCLGIKGASRFKHNNGWHKGHLYTRISAGRDYDLTGLKIKVRDVVQIPSMVQDNDHRQKEGHVDEQNTAVKPVAAKQNLAKDKTKRRSTAKNAPLAQKGNKGKPPVKPVSAKQHVQIREARPAQKLPKPGPLTEVITSIKQQKDHAKKQPTAAKGEHPSPVHRVSSDTQKIHKVKGSSIGLKPLANRNVLQKTKEKTKTNRHNPQEREQIQNAVAKADHQAQAKDLQVDQEVQNIQQYYNGKNDKQNSAKSKDRNRQDRDHSNVNSQHKYVSTKRYQPQ
jgi:hypothetical protein